MRTTMVKIDSPYCRSYLKGWASSHGTNNAELSLNVLQRSRSYIAMALKDGRMRPIELKALCDHTGMDYDRATKVGELAEPSENEGG